MTTAHSSTPAPGPLRRTVLLGLFTGTAVGAGFLLSGVPGLELMTLIAALAGGVLGAGAGFVCGALSMTIYSLSSPLGAPLPLLLAAQAVGLGAAGAAGGWLAPAVAGHARAERWLSGTLVSLGLGLGATMLYDLVTNLAIGVALAMDLRVVLAGAVPLAAVHLATNGLLFASLHPLLIRRFGGAGRPALRGRTRDETLPLALALVLALAAADAGRAQDAGAAPDSTGAVPADVSGGDDPATAGPATHARPLPAEAAPAPQRAERVRPLWQPYPADLLDWLAGRPGLWVARDGGFGAPALVQGEASGWAQPRLTFGGVPLASDHRWARDAGTVMLAGRDPVVTGRGLEAWGGTAGAVELAAAENAETGAFTDARFYQGPHGMRLRFISFRTPRAPWRLRFDFEETIDPQGYEFAVPGDDRFSRRRPDGLRFTAENDTIFSEAKFRSWNAALERSLSADGDLRLELGTLRKHRTDIPSLDLDREEVWAERAAITWRDAGASGRWRTSLFWSGRDVVRLDRDPAEGERKLEVHTEGALLEWRGRTRPLRLLRLTATSWRLQDDGPAGDWAPASRGGGRDEGQEASLAAQWPLRLGGLRTTLLGGAWWDAYGGWRPGGRWTVGPAVRDPVWTLTVERGGRAPRSDELLTAERLHVPGRSLVVLPNRDLGREDLWRAAVEVGRRILGTDVAVTGSLRRLRHGIVWVPVAPPAGAAGADLWGRWENALDRDSRQAGITLRREGRLAGWVRLRLDATWRGGEDAAGVARGVPPARTASLLVLWEKSFFRGDGILELGYRLASRGETDDPWWPAERGILPAATRHDLMIGFRLVGADLSLLVRNLTDVDYLASAGALAPGRESFWRLHWTFVR